MRVHAPVQVVIGFSLGILAMLGIRSFTRKLEGEEGDEEGSGEKGDGTGTKSEGLRWGRSADARSTTAWHGGRPRPTPSA